MLSFQPLIFWGFTVVTSFIFDAINGSRMFKDAADNGYTINIRKLSALVNSVTQKGSNLVLLVPILNIFTVFKKTIDYNNNREIMLGQLNALGILDEMSDSVKEKYNKKPTLLNSVVCSLNNQVLIDIKKRNSDIVETEINEAKELGAEVVVLPSVGAIYYKMTGDKIEIIKSTRSFENFKEDALISFVAEVRKNHNIVSNKEENNKEIEQTSKLDMINDTKEKYQSLRDEIVRNVEFDSQQESKEENPTLNMRK